MSVIVQTSFTGVLEPINHPRICFDKHSATATATSSATGYDPAWVTDGETWSIWQAGASSASLTITFPSLINTNYAAIAAHTLDAEGVSVQLQGSTNGTTFTNLTGVSSHSPTDDSAILWLFANTSLKAVRFVFSGGVARLGVAQAGEALELPRLSVFTGLPISESREVSYRHQQSVQGDILGRAVEGAMLKFSLTINNLPETFRAASGDITWKGFLQHITSSGPFFLAAKPTGYPDDVAYVQITERPRFERQTPNYRLSGSISLNCIGYART